MSVTNLKIISHKSELEKLLTILTFWWLKIFLNKFLVQGKLRSSLNIALAFDIEIPGTNEKLFWGF